MPKIGMIEISQACALAIHAKEKCVEAADSEEGTWMPPIAMLVDTDDQVDLTVFAPGCDKAFGIQAVYSLRLGWAAERVTVAFDAFSSPQKSARPGEFQERFLAGATREDDGIGSLLLVLTVDAGGKVSQAGFPYHRRGKAVVWMDPGEKYRRRDEAKFGGPLVEALRKAMAATPMCAMPELVDASARMDVGAEQLREMPKKVMRQRLETEGYAVFEAVEVK